MFDLISDKLNFIASKQVFVPQFTHGDIMACDAAFNFSTLFYEIQYLPSMIDIFKLKTFMRLNSKKYFVVVQISNISNVEPFYPTKTNNGSL